jgi:riboflavin biosynthesis pyrimidine reductase
LNAGLLDELLIHVAPVLLGSGVRLLEHAERKPIKVTRALESPQVAHLIYAVSD